MCRQLIAATIVVLFANGVFGQTTTFAQFVESSPNHDIIGTNNGGTSFSLSNINGGVPVNFFYSNINGLDPQLIGSQAATLTISGSTTMPATSGGGNITQTFTPSSLVTVTILRNTPATVGNGTRRDLLTVTFSGDLFGGAGGNQASFNSSTPGDTVTFASDFLDFTGTTARSSALAFSSVNPSFSLGAGNFVASFTADMAGTYSSNPPPVVTVPEPATVIVLLAASGITCVAVLHRRRKRRIRADVELIDPELSDELPETI
jgi:hypothetical protein